MRRREIPGVGLTPLEALMGKTTSRLTKVEHSRMLFGLPQDRAEHILGADLPVRSRREIPSVGLTPLEALMGKRRILPAPRLRLVPKIERRLSRVSRLPPVVETSRAEEEQFGHLIVIPSRNRPHDIERCVRSIAENRRLHGKTGKVRVIVVNDSDDAIRPQYETRLRKLADDERDALELIHFDKNKQEALIADLKKETGVDVDQFLFINPKARAGHNYGCVRNLALLVAMRHARPNDLVTFFDDDVTLESFYLRRKEGQVSPSKGHLVDFFSRLSSIFSNKNVLITSGRMSRHTMEPQALIPYYLEKADLFVDKASDRNPSDTLGELSGEITDMPGLGKEISFAHALRLLSVFSRDVVRRGAFNVGLRYYDENAPTMARLGQNSGLGGSNVTIRAEVLAKSIPYPTVDIRGEDTTWSMLMHRLLGGGVYRINLPVLHYRGGARDPLVEYGQSMSYVPVYGIIKSIYSSSSPEHLASQLKTNATEHSVGRGYKQLGEYLASEAGKWKVLVDRTSRRLSSSRVWWNADPKLRRSAEYLRQNIEFFGPAGMDKVRRNIVPQDKLLRALHYYADLVAIWPAIANKLVTTAVAHRRAA